MKTLSRVFTVWCWCLCITAFGFAKEAVTQEQVLQQNTPEQQIINKLQNDIQTKEELEAERNKKVAPAHTHDHEGDCEEASPRKVNVEDAYKVLELTPAQIAAKEAHRLAKENANPISVYSVENEAHLKGYDTLEEYIQAVNADRESISKEGAVSYEAYLQGLEAKDQATPLEYNLQSPSNTEGTIVTNPQTDKKNSKEELRLQMETEKAEHLNSKIQKHEELNNLQSAKESVNSLEFNLQPVQNTEGTIKTIENDSPKFPFIDPKLKDYIDQGLGRAENNTIITSEGSDVRDGSVTLTGADSYGDGWNGNELCVNGACYAVEGDSGSWDLGVLASGDYAVTCGGGSWGSEVSWAFTDAAGNTLLSGSVGDYTLTVGDSGCADADAHSLSVGGGSWGSEVGWSIAGTSYSGSVGDFSLCLADGDYTFDMTDAYGDGWNGNTATITDSDGSVVVSGGLSTGDAGSFDFSLGGPPPVGGCTDPNAPNYHVIGFGNCYLQSYSTQGAVGQLASASASCFCCFSFTRSKMIILSVSSDVIRISLFESVKITLVIS